ncbi:MAG: lipopolysaccharide transport system ATP-binding protein [Burkholderiales bacterium]|jgi:lipopolysaccharide transport system ATP-binding protein
MTEKKNLAIEAAAVSKVYQTYAKPRHRLMEILSGGRRRYASETHALDTVSFSLEKGGRLGIVGENGSGKSTLLKVLAGVLTPSGGFVVVNGRVSALLELGAGFNPELIGRENVSQFCMLHGMRRDQIEEAMPEIIRFSELGHAIDHPVKTYSSGMAVRLGFACAVYVQPDILIVDEALSVGDAYFQNKCLHKIRAMLDNGTSFVYVTHAADKIRSLCNQGLWLDKGKVRLAGSATRVGAAYQSHVFSRMVRAGLEQEFEHGSQGRAPIRLARENLASGPRYADSGKRQAFFERVAPLRTGSGEIRIDDISVIGHDGEETDSVVFDRNLRIRVFFHVESAPRAKSAVTLGVTDTSGRQLLHFSSLVHGIDASDTPPHTEHVMEFVFHNPLCPGEYGVIAGISILTGHPENRGQTIIESVLDYCVGGARFKVLFPDREVNKDLWGVVHVDYRVSMHALDAGLRTCSGS